MYSVYHQETLVPAAVSVTSLTVIGASAPTPFEILTPTILLPPAVICTASPDRVEAAAEGL